MVGLRIHVERNQHVGISNSRHVVGREGGQVQVASQQRGVRIAEVLGQMESTAVDGQVLEVGHQFVGIAPGGIRERLQGGRLKFRDSGLQDSHIAPIGFGMCTGPRWRGFGQGGHPGTLAGLYRAQGKPPVLVDRVRAVAMDETESLAGPFAGGGVQRPLCRQTHVSDRPTPTPRNSTPMETVPEVPRISPWSMIGSERGPDVTLLAVPGRTGLERNRTPPWSIETSSRL